MLLVGLTGNYGMGKSTVLQMFRELEAVTLNTDDIVSLLLREKDVLEKIKELLGEDVISVNGSLDKRKVADVIFHDASLRHSLEDILHPLVFEKIKMFSNEKGNQEKVIIIEVPLLYERGYEDRFDRTITIFTEQETALNRLEQSQISRREALLRLKAQLPVEEKIKRSDFRIDNNGSLEETKTQVEKVYKELLKEVNDGDNQRIRGSK